MVVPPGPRNASTKTPTGRRGSAWVDDKAVRLSPSTTVVNTGMQLFLQVTCKLRGQDNSLSLSLSDVRVCFVHVVIGRSTERGEGGCVGITSRTSFDNIRYSGMSCVLVYIHGTFLAFADVRRSNHSRCLPT